MKALRSSRARRRRARVETFDFGAKEGIPRRHHRLSDRLPSGELNRPRVRRQRTQHRSKVSDREGRDRPRDSDKGKAIERWRRKVTGLTGPARDPMTAGPPTNRGPIPRALSFRTRVPDLRRAGWNERTHDATREEEERRRGESARRHCACRSSALFLVRAFAHDECTRRSDDLHLGDRVLAKRPGQFVPGSPGR